MAVLCGRTYRPWDPREPLSEFNEVFVGWGKGVFVVKGVASSFKALTYDFCLAMPLSDLRVGFGCIAFETEDIVFRLEKMLSFPQHR